MIGALVAEFFARDTPKYLLVYIAIGLLIISVIDLYYGFTHENQEL